MGVGQRGGMLPLGVLPGEVNKPIGSEGPTPDRQPGGKFGQLNTCGFWLPYVDAALLGLVVGDWRIKPQKGKQS